MVSRQWIGIGSVIDMVIDGSVLSRETPFDVGSQDVVFGVTTLEVVFRNSGNEAAVLSDNFLALSDPDSSDAIDPTSAWSFTLPADDVLLPGADFGAIDL